MKYLANLINSNVNAHKRLERLRLIQEDALREGVTNLTDLQDSLASGNYQVPTLFPLNQLASPITISQFFRDTVSEVKSVYGLGQQYVQSIIENQEEIYRITQSSLNDWFSIRERAKILSGYQSYMYRSIGNTMSIFNLSFWSTPEGERRDLDINVKEFSKCYNTLNNQLTLPIESFQYYNIKKIDILGVDGEKNNNLRIGPFLFNFAKENTLKNIVFKISLDQEQLINHLKIPICLPLPKYIDSILLRDSSNRLTRRFDKSKIQGLIDENPSALELIFTPTPCRNVEIVFSQNLNTIKSNTTIPFSLDNIANDLASGFSNNIELLNARGQLDIKSMQDSLSNFFLLLDKKAKRGLNETLEGFLTTIGIVAVVSLTSFQQFGKREFFIYSNNPVKFSTFIGNGTINSVVDNETFSVNEDGDRSTFVNAVLFKEYLDNRDSLLARFRIPQPFSRPFISTYYDHLNVFDSYKNTLDNIETIREYQAQYYPINQKLYIPTVGQYQEDTSVVYEDDSKNENMRLKIRFSNEDLVAKYTIDTKSSFSILPVSIVKPFHISSLGSVIHDQPNENVAKTNLILQIVLSRVEYNNHITPILGSASLVIGHAPNQGTGI